MVLIYFYDCFIDIGALCLSFHFNSGNYKFIIHVPSVSCNDLSNSKRWNRQQI